MKKRFLLVFSVLILFFATPLQSLAALSGPPASNGIKDSHTFEHEGETYTITLETNGNVQTAYVESETNGLETVSYDRAKDELRFNNEVASDEFLAQLKGSAEEISEGEQVTDIEFSTMSTDYNWRLVKTFKNSFNVAVGSVLVVTGIILLLPTGTGALMGVVLTAKIISVMASAIVSASDTSGSVVYYTFKTYYSPKNGYYNNRFVFSVYKDSKRTKHIKTVEHITRLGKKYD